MPILAKHSKNMNLEKISKEDPRKSICFLYEVNCKGQKRSELTNIVKYTLSKFQNVMSDQFQSIFGLYNLLHTKNISIFVDPT